MARYAFIIIAEGLDPASYRVDFQSSNDQHTFVGVDNRNQAEEIVGQLSAEGCQCFDFCAGFTAEDMPRLAKAAAPGARLHYATFTGEEVGKQEKADFYGRFGVIIFDQWIGQTKKFELEGIFPTSVRYVNSVATAFAAARELDIEGTEFIEMCSWFDDDKTRAIISAVRSDRMAIGTAGRNEWIAE